VPRHDRSNGVYHSTRQRGHSRRSNGRGTYSKKYKGRAAQRLSRIYLEGTYSGHDLAKRRD
jgi:hypothetical protein